MCTPKQPQQQTPAAAPPPPADPASAPVVDAVTNSQTNLVNAKRAGRRSLRIDLASSGPSGGSGLNIPTA